MKAVAYLRTSSATNVGADKDSDRRQREAINSFAKRAGIAIVDEYYDAAVSGGDAIESRPGFAALLDRIESNGVRTVIVEDATRFARELLTQELGILALIGRGVTVLTATGEDLTNTDDPMKVAMRQIAGAFARLEKARLVTKLKKARDNKRKSGLKVEGRKSHAELKPDVIEVARRLHRKDRKGERRSYREIAAELAQRGHLSAKGTPFSPSVIKTMIGR
ncbi:recombinase family protein [Rhizobium lusitanum]|uniref:recombinase family protein n=1 Tax=Rhizobium lusitanum TaxID=293958 RepID=UPI001FEF8528|nr:recombinase family protein [Rhizobium lusitanum]